MGYTPSDSQVLAAIPFIAEFKLACDGGETPALYADIDGVLMPVTKSSEGEKYQVSWTQEVKKATTGDRSVALYDTEGFTALRKSRALGQASTVSPLVTIVIPYPGSYSGPWLNSEHLAAALAAAVFLPGFLFKVQSFGLSLGPGENTEKRRSSKCFSKSSHPCLPTFRLFNSALLLKYSQLLVSLIHQKEAFHVTFEIWLWRNIKTKLKEIMMAFVYKQNIIYIFSLHLIQKFITTNQRALPKTFI